MISDLNKLNLSSQIELPKVELLSLKERVIQFGTGVLLRALPDDYIDQANKRGDFMGRIVVVKSTDKGDLEAYREQQNLYTIAEKGITNGKIIEKYRINASISRALSAKENWPEILQVAQDIHVNILISNTTEAGIVESNDDIFANPPKSYPAKITSYLYQRYLHFEGNKDVGMVILPTELISDNADQLKKFVIQLAQQHNLSQEFIKWIEEANHFCNTLVDRIVPGHFDSSYLGYKDKLAIITEPFSLWAIESNVPYVYEMLSFAHNQDAIKIVPSIEHYKEIKLRLLNASHSLACGVALIGHYTYVKDSLKNDHFENYLKHLLKKEISPCLWSIGLKKDDTQEFADAVIDRFKNPFLFHKWSSIATNFIAKIKMRVLPLLEIWYQTNNTSPKGIAFGFAAFLLYMRTEEIDNNTEASQIVNHWKDSENPIHDILSDKKIWGNNLCEYPHWEEAVALAIQKIELESMEQVLSNF